jgi:hypothetical protein
MVRNLKIAMRTRVLQQSVIENMSHVVDQIIQNDKNEIRVQKNTLHRCSY